MGHDSSLRQQASAGETAQDSGDGEPSPGQEAGGDDISNYVELLTCLEIERDVKQEEAGKM